MRTDYKSDRAENTIWGQRVPRNFPKGGYKLYLPFLNNSEFWKYRTPDDFHIKIAVCFSKRMSGFQNKTCIFAAH